MDEIRQLSWEKARIKGQEGAVIARKGWDTTNQYVFWRPEWLCNTEEVMNIQSIPQPVKEMLHEHGGTVKFSSYPCKYQFGEVINGWHPNHTDLTATDWVVIVAAPEEQAAREEVMNPPMEMAGSPMTTEEVSETMGDAGDSPVSEMPVASESIAIDDSQSLAAGVPHASDYIIGSDPADEDPSANQ